MRICLGRRRNSRFREDSRIGKPPDKIRPGNTLEDRTREGNLCLKPYVGQVGGFERPRAHCFETYLPTHLLIFVPPFSSYTPFGKSLKAHPIFSSELKIIDKPRNILNVYLL